MLNCAKSASNLSRLNGKSVYKEPFFPEHYYLFNFLPHSLCTSSFNSLLFFTFTFSLFFHGFPHCIACSTSCPHLVLFHLALFHPYVALIVVISLNSLHFLSHFGLVKKKSNISIKYNLFSVKKINYSLHKQKCRMKNVNT